MYSQNMTARHACSLCDKTFSRKSDATRHEDTVHYEEKFQQSDDNDDPSSEEPEHSEEEDIEVDEEKEEENDLSDSESDMSTYDLEDNPTYQEWYQQALDGTQEMRDQKYDKYINEEGMDEEDARVKAHEKTLWLVKRIFFENYTTYLRHTLHIMEDEVHQEVLSEIEGKMADGMDMDKAVKKVLLRIRPQFDSLFEYEEMATDDEEDNENETDESD